MIGANTLILNPETVRAVLTGWLAGQMMHPVAVTDVMVDEANISPDDPGPRLRVTFEPRITSVDPDLDRLAADIRAAMGQQAPTDHAADVDPWPAIGAAGQREPSTPNMVDMVDTIREASHG